MWADSLSFLARSFAAKQRFTPRPEAKVPAPKSLQAAIVEGLRLSRLWGARIPDGLPKRLGDLAELVRWYNLLIDYCEAYPMDAQSRELPIIERLDTLPFSIDWFRSIEGKRMEVEAAFPLMYNLEQSWTTSMLDKPGQVDLAIEEFVYTVRVDWVDISRLGYHALMYRVEAD